MWYKTRRFTSESAVLAPRLCCKQSFADCSGAHPPLTTWGGVRLTLGFRVCHVKRALGVGRLLQGGGRPNNPSRARTLCVSPHPGPPRIFHYSGLVFPKVLPSLCARYVLLMNNRPKVRSRGSKIYVFWVPLKLRVLAVARASGVGQEATPAGRRSTGQGAELPHVTIWLDRPGQRAAAYVAMSRVRRDKDYKFGGKYKRKHFLPAL